MLHKGGGGLLHVRVLAVDDHLVGSKQISRSQGYARAARLAPGQFRYFPTYLLAYRVDLLLELLEEGVDERLVQRLLEHLL